MKGGALRGHPKLSTKCKVLHTTIPECFTARKVDVAILSDFAPRLKGKQCDLPRLADSIAFLSTHGKVDVSSRLKGRQVRV